MKVQIFKLFIEECKQRNIKLIIACSPYYINQVGTDISMELAKEIAKQNNVDFLDYSKIKEFINSPQLFNDTIHVNTTGAAIFSKMVAHDIREIVSKSSDSVSN